MTFKELLHRNRISLMGFSMICIMLYHQPWFVDNPIASWFHLLGYIGVEIFLVLSGFSIAYSLQKNNLKIY